MGDLEPRRAPLGVGAKWRRFLLMAALAAPLSLGVSEPALAQCTDSGSTASISCPLAPAANPYSFGFQGNTYSPLGSAGINAPAAPTESINITTLNPGVNVIIPSGAPIRAGDFGINAI